MSASSVAAAASETVLEKDRAARGLDYRSYFQELASDRYRLLLRQQFEEEGGRKPKK